MRPTIITASLLLLVAVGCSSGDDAAEGEETESSSGDAADEPSETGTEFTLSSSAFGEGDPIPDDYAFLGGNVSPPLSWTGTPGEAVELAVTVVDPDANNFVHWVVVGLDPSLTELAEGAVPPGAVETANQFPDETGWGGPAPPPGAPHTYVFTVHALSESSGVDASTSGPDALDAVEAVTVARAELRGQYETDG